MKSKLTILLLYVILSVLCSSCEKMLLDEETPNTPTNNFEILWKDYNEMYGPFVVKNTNWDSLYHVYRPLINDNSTDIELYNAITGLISNLDDNHVTLTPVNSNLQRYESGILGRMGTFTDFNLSVVQNNYLTQSKEYCSTIQYGKIGKNVGYIHISNITEGINFYEKALNDILDYMKDTDGIIIDIRNNSGGIDKQSIYIAGRFTNESKSAFTFRLKNGTAHDSFTPFYEYTVKPEGDFQYLNKVVLLTHRFTISAAETFTLSMARNDNVTIVGDTTSGAFSDMTTRELPNGWIYTISVGDWRDFKGESYEGIGYPPDVVIQNQSRDIENGKDEALETSISIITSSK